MAASMLSIVKSAALSVLRFGGLVISRSLHLRRGRVGELYEIDQGGTYKIFRETVGNDGTSDSSNVLVVGFRMRLLRRDPLLHWIFQRACIMTTPFWSGFRGFRVKLWMVDPTSKDYLGIYDWAGRQNAQSYVDALVRVLRPLSTPGSVWYELYPDQELDAYLHIRKQIILPLGKGLARHAG
ncbi:MAG: hypothetical protein ACYC56_12250 [Candidatus Aquicultor sp.]